jgi:hypothetical protein
MLHGEIKWLAMFAWPRTVQRCSDSGATRAVRRGARRTGATVVLLRGKKMAQVKFASVGT